mgnify:CR=1 FL=1
MILKPSAVGWGWRGRKIERKKKRESVCVCKRERFRKKVEMQKIKGEKGKWIETRSKQKWLDLSVPTHLKR